jgi:hypothetical protein
MRVAGTEFISLEEEEEEKVTVTVTVVVVVAVVTLGKRKLCYYFRFISRSSK